MRQILTLLAVLVLVLAGGSAARAEDVSAPPASCFEKPERWTYDRTKEAVAAPGERFFEDMKQCAPTFAANLAEAIRYQIQQEETDKFVHQRSFVLWAYAIAWALLAIAGLLLWLRQQRLVAELRELEERLRVAGGAS